MCSEKTGVTAKSFFLARHRGRLKKVASKQGTRLSKFCGVGGEEELGDVGESDNNKFIWF